MLRNVAEPGDSGGLVGNVPVETADNSATNDRLLLFVQQSNQFPLGADEAIDLPVRVVQKPYDGRLFAVRRQRHLGAVQTLVVDVLPLANAGHEKRKAVDEWLC